ncbi:MAG TPA: helix-turn-helix domain-containing protein [Thermoleophilaceae bacterium]|jgi:DNA-binding HxlR family transcriptional regulator
MLDREYRGQVCSIARALEIVGDRWTLLILRDTMRGIQRFDQIRDSLGVASNVLSNRLDRLCEEGILERHAYRTRPARYEYRVTRKGASLWPTLFMLMKWGDRFYASELGPPLLTVHRGCGGEVDHRLVCPECGERVSIRDLDVIPGPGAPDQVQLAAYA